MRLYGYQPVRVPRSSGYSFRAISPRTVRQEPGPRCWTSPRGRRGYPRRPDGYPLGMRALTVLPLRAGSLRVDEVDDPVPGEHDLLVEGLAVGVCGTDREIAAGEYGW